MLEFQIYVIFMLLEVANSAYDNTISSESEWYGRKI